MPDYMRYFRREIRLGLHSRRKNRNSLHRSDQQPASKSAGAQRKITTWFRHEVRLRSAGVLRGIGRYSQLYRSRKADQKLDASKKACADKWNESGLEGFGGGLGKTNGDSWKPTTPFVELAFSRFLASLGMTHVSSCRFAIVQLCRASTIVISSGCSAAPIQSSMALTTYPEISSSGR
jgi:hypothetical protein